MNEINIKVTATTSVAGPVDEAEKKVKGFGNTLKDVGKIAAGVLTAELLQGAAERVKDFVEGSIDAANDLGESVNAVSKIFHENADQVERWAQENANNIGLSQRAFNQAVVPLGAALKNAGLDLDQTTDKTLALTQRAADMASVFNTDVTDALTSIQAALRGESDPIEKYGVGLSAAAVEQRALADSGKKSAAELTKQELTLARLSILFEQTNDTAGDFKDTINGYANSQRVANAQIEDAKAKLGEGLLPVLAKATQIAGDAAEKFGSLPHSLQLVIGAVTVLGTGLLLLTPRIVATKAAMTELGITMTATRSFLAGPWGIAIGIATAALTAFTIGQVKAKARTDEFSKALDFQAGALDENNRAFIANKLEQEGLLQSARELGISTEDLVSAVLGNRDAYDRLGISTINVNRFTDEATAKRKKFNDAVTQMIGDVNAASQSHQREATATKAGTAATKSDTNAREENIAAIKEQSDQIIAQTDPMFKLIGAQKEVTEKQKTLTEAVHKHGKGSKEAREAELDLAQSIIALNAAAAGAAGKFDGHFTPALRAILKTGGLTASQIKDVEKAFNAARTAGEKFEQNYAATASLTIKIHGLTSIHFDSEGNPVGHAFGGAIGAASGGSRGGVTIVNDGAGVRRGELVRLPFGASVIPAGQSQGMLEAMMSQSRLGGPGGRIALDVSVSRQTGLAFLDGLIDGIRFKVLNEGNNDPQTYLKG